MIKTFRCKDTELLFHRVSVKRFKSIETVAYRKLLQLSAANELRDLQSPPANRLEKLDGDRKGQYSIRISGKWRICFVWNDGDASNVEIVDYH